MASIYYRTDKKTGNVYAYSSVSYRDPVTKKPRNKRTYLGRVDPISHEILPKAEAGQKRKRTISKSQLDSVSDDLKERVTMLTEQVQILEEKLNSLEKDKRASQHLINGVRSLLKEYDIHDNSD